ncbi:uncharacterized protein LOC121738754 [Aricia agestis]|uniref:uncharacterized protein LOC121738754 n=1 Tax=Aricia agestis TaxID=91739 RepID=UPI001C208DB2|nr:uncharacterized protein LOC121738754 [Aricia agestis]
MDTAADEDPPKNGGRSEEVPNTSDFEQGSSKETDSKIEDSYELASATNPNVVTCNTNMEINSEEERRESEKPVEAEVLNRDNNSIEILVENETLHKQDNVSDSVVKSEESIEKESVNENIGLKSTNFVRPDLGRMRKLSLDQSILSRSEGLSQSELNLSYIGKKPLERKPSFFRKKMDTFLRNTTEMFKKRTSQLQSSPKTGSLQCLNENQLKSANSDENFRAESLSREDRNRYSLAVKAPIARSVSSLSVCQSGRYSRRNEQNLSGGGSQPVLNALGASTEELEDNDLSSVHSLNESFLREHMLKSRAISMNSGLDSPTAQQRKRASRSNRVTWVASEGLTNYFRRLQDLSEKKEEMQSCQSYQDFSRVPENDSYKKKVDSKGRRLSYQRAVSGEDPVLPSRFQESMRTRNPIPENNEAHYELANQLADFSANGIPQLQGYAMSPASDEVFAYLMWAETPTYIDDIFDWNGLTPEEEAQQSVIKELINTEADYIRHLMSVVEVFIAAAHSLQDSGKMLNVETERLFSNMPDVLNASLTFWQTAFLPMIKDSVAQAKPFNTELMAPGFCRFREILSPYDRYVKDQSKTVEYLRSISTDPEFTMYLNWCHSHKLCNRLQLADFLVKPMQRLTKYSLILRRIITHTDTEPERTSLLAMETFTKNYVLDLNRSVRQREELEKLEEVANSIESYEVDFKDEDLDRYFRMFSQLNLRSPMVGCVGSQSRCVVFQGDMRFKDNVKELNILISDHYLNTL